MEFIVYKKWYKIYLSIEIVKNGNSCGILFDV